MHQIHFGVLHDYRVYKTLMIELVHEIQARSSEDPDQEAYRPKTEERLYSRSMEYKRIAELFRKALGMNTFDYMEMSYDKDKYNFPQPNITFQQEDLQAISKLPPFKLRFPENLGKRLSETVYRVILVLAWLMDRFEISLVWGFKISEPFFISLGRGVSKVWKRFTPVQDLLEALIPEQSPRDLASAQKKPPES